MDERPSRYLLDTDAWFWLVTGDPRIAPIVDELELALVEGRLFLSQLSTSHGAAGHVEVLAVR